MIPDLGTTCGRVSGRLYVDGNANCALNGGENLVPNTVIEVTPGPLYVTTDAYGQYSVDLPYGSYTLTEQHPVLDQGCPAEVTLGTAQLPNTNIGCLAGAPLDVPAHDGQWAGEARVRIALRHQHRQPYAIPNGRCLR